MSLDGGWHGSANQARSMYDKGRLDGSQAGYLQGLNEGMSEVDSDLLKRWHDDVTTANYIINDLNSRFELSKNENAKKDLEIAHLKAEIARLRQQNLSKQSQLTEVSNVTNVTKEKHQKLLNILGGTQDVIRQISQAYDLYLMIPEKERKNDSLEKLIYSKLHNYSVEGLGSATVSSFFEKVKTYSKKEVEITI